MEDQYGFLQTITGDQQGGIWVSFDRHGLYRLANWNWTSDGGRDDLPRTRVIAAFTDSLDRVCFGYANGQLAILEHDLVRVFGPRSSSGHYQCHLWTRTKVWIGGEFGLEQFDDGRFHKITAVDDQWLRGISGIVEMANGDLWLNAISGIFHIRKAEISEALKDSTYRIKGEHFGRRKGLPGVANGLRPLPAAIEGTDGRLWFSLRNEGFGLIQSPTLDIQDRKRAEELQADLAHTNRISMLGELAASISHELKADCRSHGQCPSQLALAEARAARR